MYGTFFRFFLYWVSGLVIASIFCLGNQDCNSWSACTVRLPDLWINKFWPLRYLFATLLVMYTMTVRWRNSLSESVSKCKHICHCGGFIFCILLWVYHNSMLLTLRKKFICSTVLHTVFVLFASQLTAALPSQWELLVYALGSGHVKFDVWTRSRRKTTFFVVNAGAQCCV